MPEIVQNDVKSVKFYYHGDCPNIHKCCACNKTFNGLKCHYKFYELLA